MVILMVSSRTLIKIHKECSKYDIDIFPHSTMVIELVTMNSDCLIRFCPGLNALANYYQRSEQPQDKMANPLRHSNRPCTKRAFRR